MTRPPLIALLTLIVGLSLQPGASQASAATSNAAAAWNQWRGPNRDGTVAGSDWPEDLSGLERLWRINLGKGYSGPLIVGNRVYVTESVDRDTEAVRALFRTNGETVWSVSWPGGGNFWCRPERSSTGSTLLPVMCSGSNRFPAFVA